MVVKQEKHPTFRLKYQRFHNNSRLTAIKVIPATHVIMVD